ncbi:MAG: single-stranded-DNA-specific exonuclease RecJ [Lachnospiraceae bacterium]|nr:single-stranded-DNA-specific exonuclease RecJ [Lachnospiraceae bacterium]
MAKWFMSTKKADFEEIGEKYHIDKVLARIIRNRDIVEEHDIEKYLYGTLQDLYPGNLMKDMEKAVAIIEEKINLGKTIRIIGDYDVDGICATYILKKGLEKCNAKVDRVIPHRIKDGYGINEALIQEAYEDGIDTIITCDNGIAASVQLEYAASLGITCIITDHHEVPYEMVGELKQYCLPTAAAVVNPKQEDCGYPFKKICGAVVAWKLVLELWKKHKVTEDEYRELLEFAGIATVCDIMELLDENRIIVKEALKSMKKSANPGLRALIDVHDLNSQNLNSYHIGFVIGPCFNATGRLDSAEKTLELLECSDKRRAVFIASELKRLNENRKEMTEYGVEEAIRKVEEEEIWKEKVMVIYLPDCHESLAGIIAGRIREKYSRPTIVLTKAEECVKGSARSIDSYSMYEELSKCKELFIKYGGHKLAAGMSLEEDKVELLRQQLNENCTLTEDDMEEKIVIDVPMPLSYVTMDFLRELELLEPFGMGNPKPVFARKDVTFYSMYLMGKNRNMAKFSVEDEMKQRFTLILFRNLDQFFKDVEAKYGKKVLNEFINGKSKQPIKMHIIYYPSVNEYMGEQQIQFVMQHWS